MERQYNNKMKEYLKYMKLITTAKKNCNHVFLATILAYTYTLAVNDTAVLLFAQR